MKKTIITITIVCLCITALFAKYKKYQEYKSPLYKAIVSGNWYQFKRYAVKKYYYKTVGNEHVLFTALRYKRYKMAKYLLDRGFNVNKTNYANATPLYKATLACDTKYVKLLLKYGANVRIARDGGYTPLHGAAACKNPKIVDLILQKKPDVNARIVGGGMPIDIAANKNRFENVKKLVQAGSKFHLALPIAVKNGNLDIVRYLANKGASVNRDNIWFKFHEMKNTRHFKQIADILIRKGLKLTRLYETVHGYGITAHLLLHSRMKMIQYFIKKGLPLNFHHKGKDVSLVLASPNIRTIKFLIRKGARLNRKKLNIMLFRVGAYQNKQLISYLLKKGANINAKDSYGRTILYFAYQQGKGSSYLKFLLRKGLNINSRDRKGNTFVHNSIRGKCNPAPIRFAVRNGYRRSIKNNKGQTAYNLAKWRCRPKYNMKNYIETLSLLSGKPKHTFIPSYCYGRHKSRYRYGRRVADPCGSYRNYKQGRYSSHDSNSGGGSIRDEKLIGRKSYSGKERYIRPFSFSTKRRTYQKFNWNLVIKPAYGFKYATVYIARQGRYYRKIKTSEYKLVYKGSKTVFNAKKYFQKHGKFLKIYVYLNSTKYSRHIKPVRANFYVQFLK